jgi:hypothetical protein
MSVLLRIREEIMLRPITLRSSGRLGSRGVSRRRVCAPQRSPSSPPTSQSGIIQRAKVDNTTMRFHEVYRGVLPAVRKKKTRSDEPIGTSALTRRSLRQIRVSGNNRIIVRPCIWCVRCLHSRQPALEDIPTLRSK